MLRNTISCVLYSICVAAYGGIYSDEAPRISCCEQETFFDVYDEASAFDTGVSVDDAKDFVSRMKRKYDMGMKYESTTDYRTHYINNSLAVFDEPVLISNYRVSDCYFEKIKIPMIFEASHVDFVTEKNDLRVVDAKRKNMEELDFAAVADFGKYWNPTDGFFQYGAGAMAYTYPDMTVSDYDYSVVAYGAMNDGWINPFMKNIYHLTGTQANCYEFVLGCGNEIGSRKALHAGYELAAYYRRYSNNNMGFTNADAAVYVGYGRLSLRARYVPFLDEEVLVKQYGRDWSGFDNGVEFYLSFQTDF